MPSRTRAEPVYGITVEVIGQTKVTGQQYLTDSLANSVLNRQLEKQLTPGTAKFLPDRLHFSRSENTGQFRPFRRDVPYDEVKRVYTFPNHHDIFMLCVEGGYEGGRIYVSFRCHNPGDLNTVKTIIYGDPGRTGTRQYAYENGYRPANILVAEQPQYAYVAKEYVTPVATTLPPRTPSPVYVERVATVVRERTPSPVYVRRVSAVRTTPAPPPPTQTVITRPVYVAEPPPEPVIVRRVQQEVVQPAVVQPTYVERVPTVYAQREPSPVVVRRSSVVSRPASVVILDEQPVHEETVRVVRREVSPTVVRHVSVARPVSTPMQTYRRSSQVYVAAEPVAVEPATVVTETMLQPAPVVYQQAAPMISRPYGDTYGHQYENDANLQLRRVSRIYNSK